MTRGLCKRGTHTHTHPPTLPPQQAKPLQPGLLALAQMTPITPDFLSSNLFLLSLNSGSRPGTAPKGRGGGGKPSAACPGSRAQPAAATPDTFPRPTPAALGPVRPTSSRLNPHLRPPPPHSLKKSPHAGVRSGPPPAAGNPPLPGRGRGRPTWPEAFRCSSKESNLKKKCLKSPEPKTSCFCATQKFF